MTTMKQLIETEDYEQFKEQLYQAKLTSNERVEIMQLRWEYLYNKYKPSDNHINARRRMSRNEQQSKGRSW